MRTTKTRLILWGTLLAWLLACPAVWAGEMVVVANSSVPVDSLHRATVADIYLGNKTRWDNGDAIHVVMLKGGATHERFAQDTVGTTPVKLKNYWKKVVFTGTGTPPKIVRSEGDMVKAVANTSGAIGYVDSSTAHGDVKVIGIR